MYGFSVLCVMPPCTVLFFRLWRALYSANCRSVEILIYFSFLYVIFKDYLELICKSLMKEEGKMK
jgi:hypothetical protein